MLYLLWVYVGYGTLFHKLSSSSNFAFSATVKPKATARYIGMKKLVLSPTQLEFTATELTILQQIVQLSA